MAEFDAELLAATGRAAAARRDPADRLVSRRRGGLPRAGRRWASPTSGSSAPRSSRSSSATARDADDPAAAQAIGEADLDLPVGRQAGLPAAGPRRERRRAARWSTPTSAARCSPAARPGRWSSPVTPSTSGRGCCRGRCAGGAGLGFAPGASVVPHYDAWPEPMSALIALQAPRGSVVLGIDEETAVVGRDGAWQVHGRGRVTVWRGRQRERYRARRDLPGLKRADRRPSDVGPCQIASAPPARLSRLARRRRPDDMERVTANSTATPSRGPGRAAG